MEKNALHRARHRSLDGPVNVLHLRALQESGLKRHANHPFNPGPPWEQCSRRRGGDDDLTRVPLRLGPYTINCVAVIACIAAMSPSTVPNLSFTTFETRAKQVVVHTAPTRTQWNTSRVLRHWHNEAASSLQLLQFAKRGMTAMGAITSFKRARAQSPLFQNGKGQQFCTRVKDDPPSHHNTQCL